MTLATSTEPDVAARLTRVRAAVIEACRVAQRRAEEVAIVAVSKFQPVSAIEVALQAGQRDFGESRVQESINKWSELRERHPQARLHLIGPLQTNKIKHALQKFDVIAVLDREPLAKSIAQHLGAARPGLQLLVQVNTGREPQKAGIAPEAADLFIEHCLTTYALPVVGVMCIPPAHEDPQPHFRVLRDLARRHGLQQISMGMSEDFAAAIDAGSTQVRLGRAIFGARPSRLEA